MNELDRSARLFIYERLAETGAVPTHEEIAGHCGCSTEEVVDSLVRLESEHALALAPTTNNLWMVHPFSAVPTPFPVQSGETTYWANCAWDVVAIAALLGLDAEARPQCVDCGEEMPLSFRGGELVKGDGLVHFVVPPRHFWDNVGYT